HGLPVPGAYHGLSAVEGASLQHQEGGARTRAGPTRPGRGGMIMGKILAYTFEEYSALVRKFHGSAAPGVMIGGFMVDLAYSRLPSGGLFDVICETAKCLPDAVQLL